MNDNDIIKGLLCCMSSKCTSKECPYYDFEDCSKKNTYDIIDLINRQKSEIERLEGESNETFHKWEILAKSTKDHYAELYEEAKGVIRAEAIKEFAERIEPKLSHNTDISAVGYQSVIADIQSVVKEMTEGKDGNV